mmetsp:Transcript_57703/g.62327  ORF Transcript_57703/g.62327 Transcript_57703/m.62327 type:complete len:103 (-) Transcript_57703:58-366(-)
MKFSLKETIRHTTQIDNLLKNLSVDTNNGVGTIMPAGTSKSHSSSLENNTDNLKYATTNTASTVDTTDTMSPQSSSVMSYDKKDEGVVDCFGSKTNTKKLKR